MLTPVLHCNNYGFGLTPGIPFTETNTMINRSKYNDPIITPGYFLGGKYGLKELQSVGHTWTLYHYTDHSPNNVINLFRNVTSGEATAGRTTYACFFVVFAGKEAVENLKVSITQPTIATTTAVEIWHDSANDITGETTIIANETTAPAGAVWSAPTPAVPLTLAVDLGTTFVAMPIWVKMAVTAGASPARDTFTLNFSSDNFTSISYMIPFFINSDYTLTVTRDKENQVLGIGNKIKYTILVKNSVGAAVDPPGNKVWIHIIQALNTKLDTTNNSLENGEAFGMHGLATRTGVGTYFWEMVMNHPGFYTVEFRTVEVFSESKFWVTAHAYGY